MLLVEAYPITISNNSVIINDREKEPLNAIARQPPNAFNTSCCWHIASKVQTMFGFAASM
ncbi:hypothetical protein GcM1_192034 [Golovinomyces cichoracearum]|uniref:MULE transposase domain-containing protein n=1 Tax=Golovinomyces cichoracearum TaxID=62708 RepID=A0A420J168_9PEZI|nr:hypothetical protein GcM1_192034 [Golovinomyces cichoracearum]